MTPVLDIEATTYFPRLRVVLAEGRGNGLEFEAAWARAMRTVTRPSKNAVTGITPQTLAFAKDAFREGFYRRDVPGNASIIGEEHDSFDEEGRLFGGSESVYGRYVA